LIIYRCLSKDGNYINWGETSDSEGFRGRYKGKYRASYNYETFLNEIDIGDYQSGQDKKLHKIATSLGFKLYTKDSPELFITSSISKNPNLALSIIDYITEAYFIKVLTEREIVKNVQVMRKKELKTVSFKSREYQLKDVIEPALALKDNKVKAIFMPPRGGKSITTLYYLAQKGKNNILIITGKPNEVRDAWKNPIKEFFDFHKMSVDIVSIQKICSAKLDEEEEVDLTKLEKISHYIKNLSYDYDAIIFDEFHWGCWHTKYTSVFQSLKKELLLVTGTPAVPADIYKYIGTDHVFSVKVDTLIDYGICIPQKLCHLTYNDECIEIAKLTYEEYKDFLEQLFDKQIGFYKKLQHGLIVVKGIKEAANLRAIVESFSDLSVINLAGSIKLPKRTSLEQYINGEISAAEKVGNKTLFVTCDRAMCGVSIPKLNYIVWLIDQENISMNRSEQANARNMMALPNKEAWVFYISTSLMINASLEYDPNIANSLNAQLENAFRNDKIKIKSKDVMTFHRMDIESGIFKPIKDYEKNFVEKYKDDFFKGMTKDFVSSIVDGLIDKLEFVQLGKGGSPNKIQHQLFETNAAIEKETKGSNRTNEQEFKSSKKFSKEQILDLILLIKLGFKQLENFIGQKNLEILTASYVKDSKKFDAYFKQQKFDWKKAVFVILIEKFYMNKEMFWKTFNIDKKLEWATPNLDFYWHMKDKGCDVTLFNIVDVWSQKEIEFIKVNKLLRKIPHL
jgi:superfamily II DNA or RNA helicase